MTANDHLRDLLYLDTGKAASIFSQLFGGLLQQTQETTEQASERRRGLGLTIGPLRPEIGSSTTERGEVVESRVLHHDLLLEVERGLDDLGVLVDVNSLFEGNPESVEQIREEIGQFSYVRVEGWAAIEDYDRISNIAGEFPALVEFISRSARSAVETTPEYQELLQSFEERKQEARALPNKQQRSAALREIGEQEKVLEQLLRSSASIDPLEPWFIEGVQMWLRVFLPGRVTLRIYPFPELPSFQVFGNLKRDSFVDADLGNLLFAYGTRPNVKLTLLGLVTSLPTDRPAFDPLAEFNDESGETSERSESSGTALPSQEPGVGAESAESEQTEAVGFERAFRGVFAGMEGMEGMARFSRYPNVTVYPIAVYRRVGVTATD